jgi:hypothetical protein
MNPFFLCPEDTVKLTDLGLLDHTLSLINLKSDKNLDDSETFLKNLSALPKGTVLEVSQVYIKSRTSPGNSVTFKIVDGAIASDFKKKLASSQIEELNQQIRKLELQVQSMGPVTGGQKTQLLYDIKSRQKRIQLLSAKDSKNIYAKLIKVSLTDVESWSIKPTSVKK